MDFGGWLSDFGGGGGDFGGGGFSMPTEGYSFGGGGLDTSGIYGGGAGGLTGFSSALDAGSAAAPAAGGGGGGFLASLGNMGIGDWAKAAGTVAQLGSTGMGIYGGIKQMQQGADQMKVVKQQQKQQQAMAAPAAAAGGALTQAGSTALQGGALPAALEAQVEDFKNTARMRYRQQLASQGITDSSMAGQMESWIETQAMKLRGELAGSLYGQGLSGIQTAMGPSQAVSQSAMGLAGGGQASLQSANKALAQLLGSQ